jgi:hypothetical protein
MRLHIVAALMALLLATGSGAQVLTSEDGPRVANKVGHPCTDNTCKDKGGCASCLYFSVYVPLDAQALKIRCYTVANYPNDFAHGDLHEVSCGQDVSFSVFDSPSVSTTPTNKIVTTTFHNRSGDRDRDAKVVVEYQRHVSSAPPATPQVPAFDPPDISGKWLGLTNDKIVFTRQDKVRFLVAPPGRGPFQGYFTSNANIFVYFADDSGCCTGKLLDNNTRIHWSNGTDWTKP